MASPITFGGLASGLDTQSIISALVSIEGRKGGQLRTARSSAQTRINTFDTLLTKLRNLEGSLKKLSDANQFVAHKSNLTKGAEDFLTVTPGTTALAGTYQIGVTALAQSTFLRSDGVADPNSDLALTGTLSVDVGGTQTDLTIDATNSTLNGIRDAINDANIGAVATTVFDGTSYFLEVRGKQSGVANAVSIVAEPTQAPPLGPLLNLTEKRAASDAAFTVDGQAYTSSDNTIDDAIQGITLQLLAPQAVGDPALQLTIDEDFGAIEQQLQSFVDDYNAVFDFLNTQGAPRASSEDAVQPLAGDSLLRSLRFALGKEVSAATTLTGIDFNSLASLGIKTESTGRLTLDSTKLKDALAADLDGVTRLISDKTAGIGKKLLDIVQRRTDTVDGAVKGRQDSFNSEIRTLDERIRRADDQLKVFEQSLRQRFPFSDFPDFGVIRLKYIPNERCIELKSLKIYINSFREIKIFHEHVVNQFRDDFVKACDPLEFQLEGDFNVRGNIKTIVTVNHKKKK